uniref:Uncharacterized protein n=1 Tax=Kwoniella bestiolae CBS 10118 TaxID=1296100 RepID=A0A1B9G4N9_9TREE|nr:hypothetical protein I302_03635 [Kwoniella bestiolae CBS 10118]OCF25958.1 hypothetical protein I302_03635 [Kwoniella bestiolae CBS 10118]
MSTPPGPKASASVLPTSHQTRWGLDGLVVILSTVAVAVSAPRFSAETEMYTGKPGDVRGAIVVLGSGGLIGTSVICLLRFITVILPKIWAHYLDRLGFTYVAMMWICWTSTTMSFTLFTIDSSLCQYTLHYLDDLPTCPILSFDLTLLHLLSILTFGQVLNYFSIALSSESESDNKDDNDRFVMWELAINSPPHSPVLQPRTLRNAPSGAESRIRGAGSGYGATSTSDTNAAVQVQTRQEADTDQVSTSEIDIRDEEERTDRPQKRDKFSKGRLWTYIPLNLCSLVVVCTSFASIKVGEFSECQISSSSNRGIHSIVTDRCAMVEEGSSTFRDHSKLRKDRVFEVTLAGLLFLVWPVSAILYTLFPPTPYQPCSNPSASAAPSPGEDYNIDPFPLCQLGKTVVTLSWIGSWILLARLMGLIFPISHLGNIVRPVRSSIEGREGENEALLNTPSTRNERGDKAKGKSKQGWQRVTAGEEFELGSEDEDE